jgi:hypothetical protein
MRTIAASILLVMLAVPVASADAIDDLARDFWAWRAATQPFSYDDIPRIERPAGWRADWAPAAIEGYRKALAGWEERWKAIPAQSDRAREVDRWLMHSAIMRVRWELDVLRGWQRDPHFYNEQTLGSLCETLLPPPPFTAQRSDEIVRRLEAFPAILEDARRNLVRPPAPFARIAIAELKDIRPRLQAVTMALKPLLNREAANRLSPAMERAIAALESYEARLQEQLPQWPEETAIGRDQYVWFLKNVALLPYTPEQMLEIGRNEWARAVAFEALEHQRDREIAPLKLPSSSLEQAKREAADEIAVRRYLHVAGLLDIPDAIKHYRFVPIPSYLAPLAGFNETDDLTSESRLQEDGSRYIVPPSSNLGYFALAAARDPRLQVAHEGAHYFQLAWSWSHEDPIRRHYYDSGANEGIAFYDEEMVTQGGLFDDSPHSREIIYNMARLRALRVEVDVKLATGQFTIEQGADYLRTMVPMDASTARAEASFFATDPGQAITYQIGKTQILGFLAEAKRKEGGAFDLARFHGFLWKNGNVPIALQKYEYLGNPSDLDEVERLH